MFTNKINLPRTFLGFWNMNFFNTWLPFIYLYVGGGIFFVAGMILIRKAKSIDMRLKQDQFWWKALIFGYFYFALIHAFLIFAALYL
jgi:zinc transporter ZupT